MDAKELIEQVVAGSDATSVLGEVSWNPRHTVVKPLTTASGKPVPKKKDNEAAIDMEWDELVNEAREIVDLGKDFLKSCNKLASMRGIDPDRQKMATGWKKAISQLLKSVKA